MSTQSADEPLIQYDIAEANASAKPWTLTLFADYFQLQPKEGEVEQVDWANLRERVQFFDNGLFLRRVLVVKVGKKSLIFKLAPEAFAAVTAWVGPPTVEDLKLSLKRRFGWVVPVGFVFVLTALPIAQFDFDPVSLGLGLALIFTGSLAKVWPHRIFFVFDSIWFAVLAGNSAWLLTQEWDWLRLVFLLVQLSLVYSGWREFRKFAPERMAVESDL